MLLSIANTTPRNVESLRVQDLLPVSTTDNAKSLLDLLQYYYEYLNTSGLPSTEIASISSLKDIDNTSLKYINQIENLIGKNIPSSKVLNRVELYKIIVKYYNTRGSEDSIHSFFKIFFDQFVQIVYPKEKLFNLSGGDGFWSGDSAALNVQLYRNLSDAASKTIGGITYAPRATDGSGQLISIQYDTPDSLAYNIAIGYDNGVITITPGGKSHIKINAVNILNGAVIIVSPDDLYYVGDLNGKPKYSEISYPSNPLTGSPSSIMWDGSKWVFYIRSGPGAISCFYSSEPVSDPCDVLAWLKSPGITSGVVNSILHFPTINAQIFDALYSNANITNSVTITTDSAEPQYLQACNVTARTYLTLNPLPLNVEVGSLAHINTSRHPYVIGVASDFGGDIVWERYKDEWIYSDDKSFPSNNYKLFDGHYWQDYSYAIRSDLDSSVWYDEYIKFVHPAGLALFSAIVIEIVSRNIWDKPLNYTSNDLNTDNSWMAAFIPPHNRNKKSLGYHTPKYQPGYLRDRLLQYIFTYLSGQNTTDNRLRLFILGLKFVLGPVIVRDRAVRNRYLVSEKFVDSLEIGAGMLNKTIAQGDEAYSNTNKLRFNTFSSYITFGGSVPNFDYSYYDESGGAADGVWDASSYDESGGAADGVWDASSYDTSV